MAARRHKALQLRVELLDIRPPIWRRIEIPSTYSFWDLHVAIQDAMGWMDCHLHEFTVAYRGRRRPIRIGVPSEDDELFGSEVQTEWQVPVTRYLGAPGDKCHYEYDFGDGWLHRVTLKKVHALQAGAKYPICTGGRRACPFEDCGGVSGYYQFLGSGPAPQSAQGVVCLTHGPRRRPYPAYSTSVPTPHATPVPPIPQ